MIINLNYKNLSDVITRSSPAAYAQMIGSNNYPKIRGAVKFYQTPMGVIVMAEINNLPPTQSNIFAFHIHYGENCDGSENQYPNVGEHFNPASVPHPLHAGDLPPLFSNNGTAWMAVLTNRFDVKEIIGKPVIIHHNPDDFTTQPSGNSGVKIACGTIKSFART
jgi:Cu-Zn family superoxide dismutase